jgi:oligoribonuclease NrnB/cAMP/cGMP phosphodiesterase (DHH superfamily)
MTAYCVYHRVDMDGKCSAAIVLKNRPDAVLVPMDYSDPFPEVLNGVHDAIIYIVDFSFKREIMQRLACLNKVIWCDHHKSALTELADLRLEGQQSTEYAGCELTWKHFYPGTHIPDVVSLIGKYDSWRWIKESSSEQERVLDFMMGCQLEDYEPNDSVWQCLLANDFKKIQSIIYAGAIIRRYEARQDLLLCERAAYTTDWEGGRWLVCNTMKASKTVFDPYIQAQDLDVHGVITWYQMPDRRIKFSLRSDHPDIDCGAIAKKYGGGGHKGAAGYITDMVNL